MSRVVTKMLIALNTPSLQVSEHLVSQMCTARCGRNILSQGVKMCSTGAEVVSTQTVFSNRSISVMIRYEYKTMEDISVRSCNAAGQCRKLSQPSWLLYTHFNSNTYLFTYLLTIATTKRVANLRRRSLYTSTIRFI